MKKAICPITKKPMDCLKCKIPNERCIIWDWDDLIQKTIIFLREVIENEDATR